MNNTSLGNFCAHRSKSRSFTPRPKSKVSQLHAAAKVSQHRAAAQSLPLTTPITLRLQHVLVKVSQLHAAANVSQHHAAAQSSLHRAAGHHAIEDTGHGNVPFKALCQKQRKALMRTTGIYRWPLPTAR